MNRSMKITLAVVVAGGAAAFAVRYAADRATADSRYSGSVTRRVFDPARDAQADLYRAEEQATTEHKNILVDVGGNWCPSCIALDQTLRNDSSLHALLQSEYVVLHVNWSSDNRNQRVLSQYPKPHGYPALYVLRPNGGLVKAENTDELSGSPEQGTAYSHDAITAFLKRYSFHASGRDGLDERNSLAALRLMHSSETPMICLL